MKPEPATILDTEWLFGSQADAAIAAARGRLDEGDEVLRVAQGLRGPWPVAAATAVLDQAILQRAAREKFSCADRLRLHRKGLEQATHEVVARYKASLVPAGARVLDACCGIGGDLLAFAEQHEVVGIDADPFTARCAGHNLGAAGYGAGKAVCARVPDFGCAGFDWVHADPDRRASGRRTTGVAEMVPAWAELEQWIAARPALIKLAPAATLEEGVANSVHRQWLGWQRECREQLVIVNTGLFKPGQRSAVVIMASDKVATLTGGPVALSRIETQLASGQYVVEPHAAVYAAGLAGRLAHQLNASQLSPHSPYLVADHAVDSGLAQSFEVLSTGPLDSRQLRDALRSCDAGTVEWKQRGLPTAEFDRWRKTRGPGSRSLTVILYRSLERYRFAVCARPLGEG